MADFLDRKNQLKRALQEINWEGTRFHDNLVNVDTNGQTFHERLCIRSVGKNRREPPHEEDF